MTVFRTVGGTIEIVDEARPVLSYGINPAAQTDNAVASVHIIGQAGVRMYCHITDDELNRLIAARDAYHRETNHRGRPVVDGN